MFVVRSSTEVGANGRNNLTFADTPATDLVAFERVDIAGAT